MQEIMCDAKARLDKALPFAMDPVVYDFAINERGTWARLFSDDTGAPPLMPPGTTPSPCRRCSAVTVAIYANCSRAELSRFGLACRTEPAFAGMVQTLFDRLLPRGESDAAENSGLERTAR